MIAIARSGTIADAFHAEGSDTSRTNYATAFEVVFAGGFSFAGAISIGTLLAAAFRAVVQDVSVVGGEQDDTARSGSFVEEGAKDGEILQVPIGGDLDGTAETVVDGVDDDSDDAPFGVGEFRSEEHT